MPYDLCRTIIDNMSRVIVGKERSIELLMVALLADGHVLLEDIPGVGKTLIAKSLAKSIGATFKRVQFTPDLLPSDITGFNVYDQQKGEFIFQFGPVMTHVLLADEINRTIPRTQSSLLESMEERQVTVDGKTYPLPHPFFVMATQNPIDLEGTFPLPEAQLDRFLMRFSLGYPGLEDELKMLEMLQRRHPVEDVQPVVPAEELVAAQRATREVHVDEKVRRYLTEIVHQTRQRQELALGASPRASIALFRCAQALAAVSGRNYVLPDDVKKIAAPVLTHRVIVRPEARLRKVTAAAIVEDLVEDVPVPMLSSALNVP